MPIVPGINDRAGWIALFLAMFLLSGCGGEDRDSRSATVAPDGLPRILLEDGGVIEGTGGTTTAEIEVQLSEATNVPVSVRYATRDVTAIAPQDYTAASGTLTIPAGEIEVVLEITIAADSLLEEDEALLVDFSEPSNATLDPDRDAATLVILDDDTPPRISIADAAAAEDEAEISFAISLDRTFSVPVSVDVDTSDGTARSPADYTGRSAQVTIPAGDTSADFIVALVDDTDQEPAESFEVTLSNPTGATIDRDTATGTILDDDTPAPPDSLDSEVVQDIGSFDRCDFTNREYCLFPWPNNWFTTADKSRDTGIRVNMNPASMPRNINGRVLDPTEWNRNDGFSPGQPILARIPGLDLVRTGAVSLTTLDDYNRDSQEIVVIDPDTGERQMIWAELDVNITKQSAGEAADPGPALIIRPAKNLTPGRRYIVALRDLRNASGSIIPAPAAFRIYRDNIASQIPQVNARRAHFENLFAELDGNGIPRANLYLAWDFTVASERDLTERMLHIRDDALAELVGSPTLTIDDVIENPNGDGAREARRIRGHVVVPCYLNTANCASGGVFNYQSGVEGVYGDGLPDRVLPVASANVPFTCTITRNTYAGAASALLATRVNPAKPALYGHGLLGSRDEGNTYGGDVRRMADDHGYVFCMVDWAGMATGNTPDDPEDDPRKYDPAWDGALQDAPTVASILVDMSNFPKLADRVQQGILNFIFLGKALLAEDGACAQSAFRAAGQCVLDRTELFYDGNSQGGIIGGALVAVSPDIRSGVLGVVGMNYSTLLRRSVDFDTYAVAFYNAYPASLDQSFILSFIQMLWDRAENNGYAWSLAPGKNLRDTPVKRVLLHPAFGDHQVTMTTAEVMARTIEARVHCPVVVAGDSPQVGPAVQPGPHPEVAAEAALVPTAENGFVHPNRRHSDDWPYFGIPCVQYPYTGNALVVWDRGPRTPARDNGTTTPPVTNTPPRPGLGFGGDPHGDPRSDSDSQRQKAAFLSVDSELIDVCDAKPCATRGFEP